MRGVIKRLKDAIYAPAPRFTGGFLANLLGWHVLRLIAFNLLSNIPRIRSTSNPSLARVVRELDIDGIAIVPDFFPQDVFQGIKEACAALELPVCNERAPHIRRATAVSKNIGHPNRLLKEALAENQFINGVISAVTGKSIRIVPKVKVEVTSCEAKDIGKETTDARSDLLHFDVCYPTYKAFLYLTDTNEQNGAFRYVRCSHRLTLSRIWLEYKMSVAFSRWDPGRKTSETPEVDSSYLRCNKLTEGSINGKANTLFIANTMGLHRRGDFLSTKPRSVLWISFRELDSIRFVKEALRARSI